MGHPPRPAFPWEFLGSGLPTWLLSISESVRPATGSSPELLRFSLWPLFHPQSSTLDLQIKHTWDRGGGGTVLATRPAGGNLRPRAVCSPAPSTLSLLLLVTLDHVLMGENRHTGESYRICGNSLMVLNKTLIKHTQMVLLKPHTNRQRLFPDLLITETFSDKT